VFLFKRICRAQQSRVQEPEYINIVSFLGASGNLIPLERQVAAVQAKVRALGFGGANGALTFREEHSPVRLKTDQPTQFVVRLNNEERDPSSLIKLVRLTPGKGVRQMLTTKVRIFSGAKSTESDSELAIETVKYGEQSFKFMPAQPLPTGEYGIAVSGGTAREAFLFGLD
jgi:hypothetical protein